MNDKIGQYLNRKLFPDLYIHIKTYIYTYTTTEDVISNVTLENGHGRGMLKSYQLLG